MIDTFPEQVRSAQAPLLRRYTRAWTALISAAQHDGAIDPSLETRLVRELLIAAMNGSLRIPGAPRQLARTLTALTLAAGTVRSGASG
jgi:hypothetical protein